MINRPGNDEREEFDEALSAGGVRAALRFLNARAPHRFTGLYRLDPPVLRNLQLFDRENPSLGMGADASLRETYCSITGSSAAAFATADAPADPRLRDHPARESTLSYCGVPLLDDAGDAVGTLCHFDLVPRPIPGSEIALLEYAAERIYQALQEGGELPDD